MSDDLVRRLRTSWDADRSIISQTDNWMRERREAADRIEELEAENKLLNDQMDVLEEWGREDLNALPDCLMRLAPALVEIDELKAKLATVVAERDEALNQLDSARHSVDVLEKRVANLLCGYDEHRKPFVTSRTTLAELKGEK